MRIDRLLYYLRFVKTRGQAHSLIEDGHIRRNSNRVTRASQPVNVSDVLTVPLGQQVKIVQIIDLPTRRGPPEEAQACYQLLDPQV